MLEDADAAIVALGSMCGTVKYVVNQLRAEGKKVGMLKITMFRPFPAELVREALKDVPVVGVFDRSSCLGNQHGPLWNEVAGALTRTNADVRHYIGGVAHLFDVFFLDDSSHVSPIRFPSALPSLWTGSVRNAV